MAKSDNIQQDTSRFLVGRCLIFERRTKFNVFLETFLQKSLYNLLMV